MTGKKATRQGVHPSRAKVSTNRGDTASIARNLDAEWRKGTFWAGVGMVAVWGPLLLMHAMGVF